MSGNWFYIRQWQKKRIESIGLEMDSKRAESLFNSMLGYDDRVYLALVNKKDKWKVVSSKKDIMDWKIIKSNNLGNK